VDVADAAVFDEPFVGVLVGAFVGALVLAVLVPPPPQAISIRTELAINILFIE
jgi:uncharacterized membrane protein YgaE (UPF0421/DUF939 family)